MNERFHYTVTIGYDGLCNGQPKEIFVDGNKLTSDLDTAGRDLATVMSIAFQHGVTPEELAKSVTRDAAGRPLGVAGVLLDAIIADTE